jgi:tetratricopeptide (TPR) repeat protein
MIVFKCKMCGGDLSVNQNKTVGKCEYCGSTMALPSNPDQMRINLYNRANHFRLNNEFDKASGIFESILNQNPEEAEAYWGLVLCKYGVVYVDDPKTHRMIPTCHRTQYISILADPDYKAAMSYADPLAQEVYESEARAIDEIQKQILDISSKEAPFDVFICYKEVDENGVRTKDSVLAQDIYYQLTQADFKVFFSRITLEDKLGSAYEPYIFGALNSAKVMVVVGTKPEYINSAWVKNEWSRYLTLIKRGEQKTLIPAYRDMDVYELPDEFSYLQAQDMSKLGFMQDLIRGIRKLVAESRQSSTDTYPINSGSTNKAAQPLIDRAFLCLEDGEFDKADHLLEQALNIDPRNASAYVGKLLCELKIKNESDLVLASQPLDDFSHYKRAIQFANDEQRRVIEEYNRLVVERLNDEQRIWLENERKRQKEEGLIILGGIILFIIIMVLYNL